MAYETVKPTYLLGVFDVDIFEFYGRFDGQGKNYLQEGGFATDMCRQSPIRPKTHDFRLVMDEWLNELMNLWISDDFIVIGITFH